jgi:hypothetical protein
MSTTFTESKEERENEKEDLLKRWKEIQKEEEEQVEDTITEAFPIQNDFFIREFNNKDNIIIDNKVKRKRFKIDNNDTETDINSNIFSNFNTNISNTFEDEEKETRITQADKTFLDLKQELHVQYFLKKHTNNHNLYIISKIYESKCKKTFILLNFLQDKENFQDFVTNNYKVALSNQHGITDFNNFKVYCTNTLQSVSQITNEITSVFLESTFTTVKM